MKLRTLLIAAGLALSGMLSGCSSTKLGAMLYCPHGQTCELRVTPPSTLEASD
jgi:hypothetical protein